MSVTSIPVEAGGGSLVVGLNASRSVPKGPRAAASLGARLVRVEWRIGTPASQLDAAVAAYARVGARVQPLAGFHGRLPTSEEAQNLRSWALRFGPRGSFWKRAERRYAVTEIEFGNETSYAYQYGDTAYSDSYAARAFEYAQRAKEAALALRGTGVRLLVQADDGGSKRSTWVDKMFEAVPDLPEHTAGWVVHPYGPGGTARIERMLQDLANHGVPPESVRIYVTEWGLSTDNGRRLDDNYGYPTDLTYQQAAATMAGTIDAWVEEHGTNLAQVILYQDYEQRASGATTNREHYFGLFRIDGSEKGAFTAEAREQIHSSGGS